MTNILMAMANGVASDSSDSPLDMNLTWDVEEEDAVDLADIFSNDDGNQIWEDINIMDLPDSIQPVAVCSPTSESANSRKRSLGTVSGSAEESDSGATGSSTQKQSSRPAKGASSSSGKRAKKQKTDGVPCILEVCQLPVLVSNATNVGDTDEVTAAIDKFIAEDVVFNVSDPRETRDRGHMTMQGKKAVVNYFESLLEIMPDIISEIRTLKRKPDSNIAYVHAVNGTISFPPAEDYTEPNPLFGIIKALVELQIENHISFVRKHREASSQSIKNIRTVREQIMSKGLPVFVKLEITGNLHFDGTSGFGAVVHRFDVQHRIQLIKPSEYKI